MNYLIAPFLFVMPGPMELVLIALLVLLLFVAKRLPEIAKGLGQSIREFRKSVSEINRDEETGGKNGKK